MAYSPELSQEQSCTLRRIGWALETPMTKAMGHIFDHLVRTLDARKVCEKCRDKTRCVTCGFTKGGNHDA